MLPMSDSVAYIHLDFKKSSIECICSYKGYESQYILSQQEILYSNNSLCEKYFDLICKHLTSSERHPLYAARFGRNKSLPYARAIVITFDNIPEQTSLYCNNLKNNFESILQKLIEVFQYYFCMNDTVFYFHVNFCIRHYYYITPHTLFNLYKKMNDAVCPIPLKIDLDQLYTAQDLKEITQQQFIVQINNIEDSFTKSNQIPENSQKEDEPMSINEEDYKNQEEFNSSKNDSSDDHLKDDKTCCPFFTPSRKDPPVLTLGKCFHWDSKNCGGFYKIDIADGNKKSTTPNLNAVAKFIYQHHGVVAWHSDCHGTTTVCMDCVSQLIDALEDPIQTNLLINGRTNHSNTL